jgi:hypothetical protein
VSVSLLAGVKEVLSIGFVDVGEDFAKKLGVSAICMEC